MQALPVTPVYNHGNLIAAGHDTTKVHQQNRVTDGRIKSKMKNQFTLKLFTKFYPET